MGSELVEVSVRDQCIRDLRQFKRKNCRYDGRQITRSAILGAGHADAPCGVARSAVGTVVLTVRGAVHCILIEVVRHRRNHTNALLGICCGDVALLRELVHINGMARPKVTRLTLTSSVR
ncbi:hypothetical protein [Streptomyces sp. NPDC101776]|uniref:hypothetical protein n=1 Tax=Streptomyces sp. NPDC101776 TaxID=3366146 RepID=UPI003818097C